MWEENHSIEPPMKSENNGVSDVCDTITAINDLSENVLSSGITRTIMSGIYKIINKVNGKYYVGSSIDMNYPSPKGDGFPLSSNSFGVVQRLLRVVPTLVF
jgi:hypothetical protein